jgi:hypothetical protein
MNQPDLPIQPAPPQPAIVVIYLTDSDSEDEPEEPEAPPAPVVQALEDIPLPNQEDFWDNVEPESRLFHDSGSESEEGENDPPAQLPRPQEQRAGQSLFLTIATLHLNLGTPIGSKHITILNAINIGTHAIQLKAPRKNKY